VDDQRIKARTGLRFEDFEDGFFGQGIRGQAVDGFGRESDHFALPKQFHGARHSVASARLEDFGFHGVGR
jgi:hypothetical protein